METGSVLMAALGIGLLIFLHELGHFLAARAAGVHVEVFSIGFGPRLFGRVVRGTDFRVSLVPFGGYVMVAGQDPQDDRYPAAVSLWSKPIWRRGLFWGGGIAMNLLFSFVVFPLVFFAGVSFSAPVVGGVGYGSPAWEAGLQPGDRIQALAGKPMYSFENLGIEIALHGPKPLRLHVLGNDQQLRNVTVVPRYSDAEGLCTIGILPAVEATAPLLGLDATGPAQRAGLLASDRLLAIGEQSAIGMHAVAAVEQLSRASTAPLTLRVQREDGSQAEVLVTGEATDQFTPFRLGLLALSRQVQGLRNDAALLATLGLQRGDVLLAVRDQAFLGGNLAELWGASAELQLTVLRAGQRVTLRHAATATGWREAAEQVALVPDDSLRLDPQPGSPAASAGIQPGDRLLQVNGKSVQQWDDLRSAVEASNGSPLQLTLERPDAFAAAAASEQGDLASKNRLQCTAIATRQALFSYGIHPELAYLREEVRAPSLLAALKLGAVCSLDMIKQLYVTMKRLLTGDVGAKNLGGIIRISQVSYRAAQRGTSWFWYFLSLLSLNLAFVNLLPVPALDGGHLVFLLIERIKGSPVNARVLGYSQVLGLVFVLLLVLFVTYNDILRLL